MGLFRQWYGRTWVGKIRSTNKTVVKAYGFNKGCRTEDITGWIREVAETCNTWKGVQGVVVAIDVATAFDETKHEQLYNAMKKRTRKD